MNREKVQEVFGKRAGFYVGSPVHADQQVLARVREWCGPLDGRTVLDVATGTGHTVLALAPHCSRAIGLDMTLEMMRLGRSSAAERGIANVEWVRGDASRLPLPDGCADVVTCRRAPHHFPDLAASLSEMARVLKAGGRLVIDDRSVPMDREVDITMNKLDRLHDPSHVRQYSSGEWRAHLEGAGLRLEELAEYRRHLPLSNLTHNADARDAREIERAVSELPKGLRDRMAVDEIDGQVHLDHYFITLRATK